MSRIMYRSARTVGDLCALVLAIGVAFFARFDWEPPWEMTRRLLILGPYIIVFEYALLAMAGTTRASWRHFSLREVRRLAGAMAVASLMLLLVRWAVQVYDPHYAARVLILPYSVIVSNFTLAVCILGGSRAVRRSLAERARPLQPPKKVLRTLLVGAGETGASVARAISQSSDGGMVATAFLDHDVNKVGSAVHGVPVLGTLDDLAHVAEAKDVDQVLVTTSDLKGARLRGVMAVCADVGVRVRIIPDLDAIVGGRVQLSAIRDVDISDLLRREQVSLDSVAIEELVRGRTALVTGAGGSIGSELCRQLARFAPSHLILVERAETALFHIHREVEGAVDVVEAEIADVCDRERMQELFARHRPAVVFHAAAYKHVPLMEAHPQQAVANNVGGTRVTADLAHQFGAQAFVFISTDKAVNPTSVMGATKRVAEMYVQGLAQVSQTRFVTVRFGNVLGSAGSVVPLFKEQIAKGGPVTVTHPEMRRYFMTIPEACQLVLQAGSMGSGGEIFILDMGEPVKIQDLARDLIRLSGVEDVAVEFTGMRPGEKLFEELCLDNEEAEQTRHPKIFVRRSGAESWEVSREMVEGVVACAGGDEKFVRTSLARAVPEYASARAGAVPEQKAKNPPTADHAQALRNAAT